jgi:ParB/RepB/Spo0J family partition protein
MSKSSKARTRDESLVQELGGLDVGDLAKAKVSTRKQRGGQRLERPIMQLRLDQIQGESPIQSRETTFDPEAYEEDHELLASIREHGVLEPIMVARASDSEQTPVYNVVFGHRRRAAAEKAGTKTIPAIIARDNDDLGMLTLAENTGGRQLSSFERAVALQRLKEARPELTQTALAEKIGTSQSTISNLLAAYNGSTPALRGLFAEGMDARAVVEMQDTFEALNEKEQVELARQLKNTSQQKVRHVKELINAGIEPSAAAVAVGTSPARKKANGKTVPYEDEQLRALSEQTGASMRSVKSLAGKARKLGAGLDAVRLACVYIAHGGKQRNPIDTAIDLSDDGRVNRLMSKRLQVDRKAHVLMEGIDDKKKKAFIDIVFFGGGHGT